MQLVYNILNIAHDFGADIAIVCLAFAGYRRLRRIERAMGMTREGEAAIKRVHENVMREVRDGNV